MSRERLGFKYACFALLALLVFQISGAPASAAQLAKKSSGSNFVLAAYDVLVDKYYEPSELNRADLLNSALEGLKETLGAQGVNFAPKKIAQELSPLDAFYLFTFEFERAELAVQKIKGFKKIDLAFAATRSMLASLNSSHTVFMNPDKYQEFLNYNTNSPLFAGIGVQMGKLEDNYFYIYDLFPDSPAKKAGLERFDRILAVDDWPVGGDVKDLIPRVRGQKGKSVKLLIERKGKNQIFEVVRDYIKPPPLRSEVLKVGDLNILCVTMKSFEGYYVRPLEAALKNNKFDGVIFDLRGNPGGYVSVLMEIAGFFLEPKAVVFTSLDRSGKDDFLVSSDERPITYAPMVVLVNGASGSAAEIFAAALQDTSRAKIVGEKSSGGVEIARVVVLDSGAAMMVSVSGVLRPKGGRIEKVGVTPDELVALSKNDVRACRDSQAEKALEVLSSAIKKK